MKNLKKYFLIVLLAELLLSYSPAYAQSAPDYRGAGVSAQIERYLCAPTPQANGRNVNSGDLYKCINQLYKFSIVMAVVVGVFFIVIAGYIYMHAEGNQESVDKAKSILESTVTSLVILLVAYILLKAINPDLIQFHATSIQPPSLVPGPLINTPGSPVNDAVTDMQGSNCAFQTNTQKIEAPQMAIQLRQKVKSICFNAYRDYPGVAPNKPVTISSIVGLGQHTPNSYHYKGCAVDFADGGGAGFTTRPTGAAILQEAAKFPELRINPGSDANQTFHIHIDLGTRCPTPGTYDD